MPVKYKQPTSAVWNKVGTTRSEMLLACSRFSIFLYDCPLHVLSVRTWNDTEQLQTGQASSGFAAVSEMNCGAGVLVERNLKIGRTLPREASCETVILRFLVFISQGCLSLTARVVLPVRRYRTCRRAGSTARGSFCDVEIGRDFRYRPRYRESLHSSSNRVNFLSTWLILWFTFI